MNELRPDLEEYFWVLAEMDHKADPEVSQRKAFANYVRLHAFYDASVFLGALGYGSASALMYGAHIKTTDIKDYTNENPTP